MSGFDPGPTHSAQDYADAFHEIMQTKLPSEQMKAVKRLLETSNKNALQEIIDTMSEDDFANFTNLQKSIFDGTYDNMNKVSQYEKQEDANKPSKLLIIMNAILFSIPNPEEIIKNINSKLQEKKEKIKKFTTETSTSVSQGISDSINYVKNTFDNIKWFVGAVLESDQISDDDKKELVKHLYNEKGYLLMKYENGEFEFDSALNKIIFDKVLELVDETNVRKSISVEEIHNSQPEPYYLLEDVAANALRKCTSQAPGSQKFGITRSLSCNGNIQPNEIKHMKQVEEIIKDKFYGFLPRSLEVGPNAVKKTKPRRSLSTKKNIMSPKTGGKTRRKIRRNKKAKTKKRKANKKTKKRKTNKKTNMNRKKSKKTNKRINKK